MFDDLRAQANAVDFEDEKDVLEEIGFREDPPKRRGAFLGMTPPQRFIVSIMLLMMTCILGAFCLLIFDRVWIPFL
jgi:hypothetical protein